MTVATSRAPTMRLYCMYSAPVASLQQLYCNRPSLFLAAGGSVSPAVIQTELTPVPVHQHMGVQGRCPCSFCCLS